MSAGLYVRHFGPSDGTGSAGVMFAATAALLGLALRTLNIRHNPLLKGPRPPYATF